MGAGDSGGTARLRGGSGKSCPLWGTGGTRRQPRGNTGGPASAPLGTLRDPRQPRGGHGGTRISPGGGRVPPPAPPFVRNNILVYFALLSDAGLDLLLSFSSH